MNAYPASTRRRVVRTGADQLLKDAPELLRNKKIGILTNHTGRLSSGCHIIDVIVDSGLGVVKALYGPEHGFRGDAPNGTVVGHHAHPELNIPIYSLYGKIHKPTKEMLEGIDVLVCDIQDVGARFYTFISTIALAMEAAAENHVDLVLLDRPNPIRGVDFDGPVRTPSLRSFVGWMPIPVTHGMTMGELARLWNEEGWLKDGVRARLEVVPMDGWQRSMWYDDTGLPWIPPSPNMRTLETATIYPGLCFVEGTNLSEGRGTNAPFQLIGAPWVDPEKVLRELERVPIEGVRFIEESFTPKDIPGIAAHPKFENSRCWGVRVSVTDRNVLRPVRLGIVLLAAFHRAHPDLMMLRMRRFDILTGNSGVRHLLQDGAEPEVIWNSWREELEAFAHIREKYLLYDGH